jgi:hypothetical protein
MPRFYFNFRDESGLMPDFNGIEFDNIEEAYLEAFAGAQEIWLEMFKNRKDPRICSFEIMDEGGALLMELPFLEILNDLIKVRPPKVADEVLIAKMRVNVERSRRLRSDLSAQVNLLEDSLSTTRMLLARAAA